MDSEQNNGKKSLVILVAVFLAIAGAAIAINYYHNHRTVVEGANTTLNPTPPPAQPTQPTPQLPTQPLPDNRVTQYYWFCWDTGNPSPHHLGHHVYGDHYCTNQELHDAGKPGY